MATVTKSIGTTGRDYSTITAWEADLDNSGIYASGDTARGEGYDDSAFNESVTINGGGTVGLAAIVLTAAAGEQHDGTAGTGVRIVNTSNTVVSISNTIPCTLQLWEINNNGANASGDILGVSFQATQRHTIERLLVHNRNRTVGTTGIRGIYAESTWIIESIVYSILASGTADPNPTVGVYGIATTAGRDTDFLNLTVVNVANTNASATNAVYGVQSANTAIKRIKNVVCADTQNAGSGGVADFFGHGASSVTATNASSDSTAPSPIAAEPVVSSVEFVSNTAPYDLHLASGAECIDAGTDLGTTPTGVNIDIDGRDRDAQADVWDVGADEFVAVGAAGQPTMRRWGGIPHMTPGPVLAGRSW